jgi:hypothetical protein
MVPGFGQKTSDEVQHSSSHVPAYAKLLILVQTFIIIYFVFWTLEEYSNNLYFQSYVNSAVQGSGFTLIAVGSVGIFTAVAVGLYLKLRQTRMELEQLTGQPTPEIQSAPSENSGTGLAPHVEQHLINMIRNSSATEAQIGPMPVLKREQPSGQAK